MLYFGSLIWGTEVSIGIGHEMSPFHLFAGLMVFVVALLLITGLVSILEGGVGQLFKRRKVVTKTLNTEL